MFLLTFSTKVFLSKHNDSQNFEVELMCHSFALAFLETFEHTVCYITHLKAVCMMTLTLAVQDDVHLNICQQRSVCQPTCDAALSFIHLLQCFKCLC